MNAGARTAKDVYMIRIIPAGRNDRVIEVQDSSGRSIKYIHSRHFLASSVDMWEDERVKDDLETLDADSFAQKYNLAGSRN